MPEQLKALTEVTEPDARQLSIVCLDPDGKGYRPLALADLHSAVSDLKLNAAVPECVHTAFVTAQHLCIYSWFTYPMNIPASFWASSCVELALKQRFDDKKSTFDQLICKAAEEDLISPEEQSRCTAMRHLRNTMAHGTDMLHNQGISFLGFATKIINRLYLT